MSPRVIEMRSMILGLIAFLPSLAAGQEPNQTAQQRYEALLKEYESASDTWSKIYDVDARARRCR